MKESPSLDIKSGVETLHAEGVAASFSPTHGCELSSLVVREDERWCELLYRGNDWRPAVGWQGRAPWLWPVAGRCYAPSELAKRDHRRLSYAHGGQVYPMERHGFIRNRVWQPQRCDDGANTFAARYDSKVSDLASYPFHYTLRLRSTLKDQTLTTHWGCHASNENTTPMPFSFGNHLTLDLRDWWGSNWWDAQVHGLGAHGFSTNRWMQVDRKIALLATPSLRDPLLQSTLVPAESGRPLRLISPDGRHAIVLTISADASDLLWVFYAEPSGAFVCCEPWVGWPNAINTGQGRIDLRPGDMWSCTFTIGIDQA